MRLTRSRRLASNSTFFAYIGNLTAEEGSRKGQVAFGLNGSEARLQTEKRKNNAETDDPRRLRHVFRRRVRAAERVDEHRSRHCDELGAEDVRRRSRLPN